MSKKKAPFIFSPESFLAEENRRLRKAGCELAIAALYVAKEYDGIHRLLLACANWTKTVADEHGRGRQWNTRPKPKRRKSRGK